MLTSDTIKDLQDIVTYAQGLEGDEKSEAQVFCGRLFRAFGYEGYKEAGATLEYRITGPGLPWGLGQQTFITEDRFTVGESRSD